MPVDQAVLDDILANLTGAPPATPSRPWCRAAGCAERANLDPVLVDRPDGSGLHVLCEEAVAATPAGTPCLEPWCVNGSNPCGHTTEAHLAAHGAAAIIAGQPTDTRASARIAAAAPIQPAAAVGAEAGDLGTEGPAAAAPPSTVAELRQVLIAYDASRPRTLQVALGPSELGTPCQQQIARKLAGAPRRPVEVPTWAPWQGTAVHAEMEKVVAFWNTQLGRERWLAEDELIVHPGIPGHDEGIRGHGDAFDQDHGCVVDWKHVGNTALNKLRTAKRMGKPPEQQVSQEYRVQAHLYGYGHERKGRRVKWVRLVLLARSWQYDDSDEWTEAYDPQIAIDAIDRYYATQDLLAALNVAANPQLITAVQATPGADACKWCPFHAPGQPAGWEGCAGDVAAHERRLERLADGLIAPGGAQ